MLLKVIALSLPFEDIDPQIATVLPPDTIIPPPLKVVGLVMAGNSVESTMVPETEKFTMCGPAPPALAEMTACLSEPAPVFAVLVTVNVAAKNLTGTRNGNNTRHSNTVFEKNVLSAMVIPIITS